MGFRFATFVIQPQAIWVFIRVTSKHFQTLAICAALGFGALSALAGHAAPKDKAQLMTDSPAAPGSGSQVLTITGRRLTQGNAVECPKIVDSAGTVHPVSHLPSTVAIGATVTVSGFIAITTKCTGPVLVVQTLDEAKL
jgi:hypothetical protein